MLTTVDVIKLCVPFLFALILLWAKEWYVAKKEREAKQEALWRMITQDAQHLKDVLNALEEMSASYKSDQPVARVFHFPPTSREFARRLVELDYTHGYVYSDYSIEAEILEKNIDFLAKLREEFLKIHDESSRAGLANAIAAQIKTVQEDAMKVAKEELKVLKRIKETRNKDEQQIGQFESTIASIEAHRQRQG